MARETTSRTPRVKSLEGLRGVLALIVVITHLQQFFFAQISDQLSTTFEPLPTPLAYILNSFFHAFFDGEFAVWTFWIISGLVLSYRYFSLVNSNVKATKKYLLIAASKRYFRLLVPVLVSVLLALILFSADLMANKPLAQHYLNTHPGWEEYAQWLMNFYNFEPSFSNALKSAIWDTFVHYDHLTTYNPVLWTMEKELFGSLFLFSFLAILSRLNNTKWLWISTVLLLTLLRLHWITAFLVGAMISAHLHSNSPRLSLPQPLRVKKLSNALQSPGLTALFVLTLWILIGLPNFLGLTNFVIAPLLITLTLTSSPLAALLSSPPLAFLGKISFGLYLGHFLLVASISSQLYLFLMIDWPPRIAAIIVAIFTLISSPAIGWLIYRIGDLPGIKLSNMIGKFLTHHLDKRVMG
jgi:peptidoglycan/LPS O-acetylase OafA/YrhL